MLYHFKTWFKINEVAYSQLPFSNLVYEIYKNIIKEKRWDPSTLRDVFYHYLTGGAQGGGKEYRHNQLTVSDQQEQIRKYQNAYQQILSGLNYDKNIWGYVEGGMYGSLNKKSVKQDSKRNNYKRYITLKEPKSIEMKKVDKLVNLLENIPSVFALKYPLFVNQLINGIDNIVIYFYDPNDRHKIDEAIQSSGIQSSNRSDYHRTNFGVDKFNPQLGKKDSDTETSSKHYAQLFRNWLNKVEPNGKTMLNYLRSIDEQTAKAKIKEELDALFRSPSPHRSWSNIN